MSCRPATRTRRGAGRGQRPAGSSSRRVRTPARSSVRRPSSPGSPGVVLGPRRRGPHGRGVRAPRTLPLLGSPSPSMPTTGTSRSARRVDAAVFRFVLFEQMCQSQMRLEATGRPYLVLDDETAAAPARQVGSEYAAWLGFQSRLRGDRRRRARRLRLTPATDEIGMELLGIAYLALDVPDVDAWSTFATVGGRALMPAPAASSRRTRGVVHLKADDRQWRVALHPAERPGIRHVGFEVGSAKRLRGCAGELAASAVTWTRGTAAECASRGVRDLRVGCSIPPGSGSRSAGVRPSTAASSPRSGCPGFVTGALGLGHYVVLTPDLDASMDFYTRVLGLPAHRLRDHRRGHVGAVPALHAAPPLRGPHRRRAHARACTTSRSRSRTSTRSGYALERATRGRARRSPPPSDATGTTGCCRSTCAAPPASRSRSAVVARLIDERTWVVNHFTGGDEWGHHGLTGEALAESVAAQ